MRIRKLGPFVAAGAILAAHAASAQSNWYISGRAGALFIPDRSGNITIFNDEGLRGPGTNTATFNPGEDVGASLGYRLPLGFRVEGELGYQHFSASTIEPRSTDGTFPNVNGARLSNPAGGDHDRFLATANLFYDLPLKFAGITPYVGAGAGYFHATSTNAVFANGYSTFTSHGSSGDGAVVLGEIGASYALTPRLSIVPAYRYEYFSNISNHGANIVKLGLRFNF